MRLSIALLDVAHPRFLGRTVMVQNGAVDKAVKQVDGLMTMDGLLKIFRLTRRYEKPNVMRRRVNYEKCKALYEEDMNRKISFAMRTNRPDPFPGCH